MRPGARIISFAVALLLLPTEPGAEDTDTQATAEVSASTESTADKAPAPAETDEPAAPQPDTSGFPRLYIPPSRAPISTRVGAATRGPRPGFPAIEALAPDHVAFTTERQPTLWWYLSAESDVPVAIALADDSTNPVVEIVETPPVRAGFHALKLSEHGVALAEQKVYRWDVALIPDPDRRSHDIMSSGAIERIEATPALRRELEASQAEQVFAVLARNGVWYDALTALCERIVAHPEDEALRATRAALFEQVGLPEAARAGR